MQLMTDSEISDIEKAANDLIKFGFIAENVSEADEKAGELAGIILRLIDVVRLQRVEIQKAISLANGIKGSDERDLFKVRI